MANLPSGTVTFLFTDVEGSTKLWELYPEEMRAALIRHDELIEKAISGYEGTVLRPRGEGDSRFAVFSRATDAVAAAAALQQALYAEPARLPFCSLKSPCIQGKPTCGGGLLRQRRDRCARLRSATHGGQTLLSQATYDLVRDNFSTNIELRDMGKPPFKDLGRPEHIFQLVSQGVPSDFPPLNTLDVRPNNLPVQSTPFIGKEDEVKALRELLLDPQLHLVTLTGPGGTGKTRLGLQAATAVLGGFEDGVFFVGLAPINDPDLVTSAIAQTLGVKVSWGGTVLESLKGYLHDREILLLLDNFEQVLEVAPLVGDLLSASPGLKVLARAGRLCIYMARKSLQFRR